MSVPVVSAGSDMLWLDLLVRLFLTSVGPVVGSRQSALGGIKQGHMQPSSTLVCAAVKRSVVA